MKIVADTYIPYVEEAIREGWPDVEICPMEPEQIDASTVRDADILIVRTRTRVNESLLSGSRVRMVCTATIGYDHIDTSYCETHGIRWASCPGCNAQAVCDYIEEALKEYKASGTIGIVGVGHVGSLVAEMAKRKGYKVLLNDPPKGIGVSLDEIARNCDIITFHVPLDDTTYHMCNAAFLAKSKPDALIINAARGGVVDETALLQSGHPYILDTWENEPKINRQVLQNAFRASMHIAGYSEEGKRNASQMCLDAISEVYGMPRIVIRKPLADTKQEETQTEWLFAITKALKAQPDAFETLRKAYPLR